MVWKVLNSGSKAQKVVNFYCLTHMCGDAAVSGVLVKFNCLYMYCILGLMYSISLFVESKQYQGISDKVQKVSKNWVSSRKPYHFLCNKDTLFLKTFSIFSFFQKHSVFLWKVIENKDRWFFFCLLLLVFCHFSSSLGTNEKQINFKKLFCWNTSVCDIRMPKQAKGFDFAGRSNSFSSTSKRFNSRINSLREDFSNKNNQFLSLRPVPDRPDSPKRPKFDNKFHRSRYSVQYVAINIGSTSSIKALRDSFPHVEKPS